MDSITAKIAAKVIEEKAFGPLLLFLHDALVAVDPEYYEKIVVQFLMQGKNVAKGQYAYKGATTILNERGERRSSLKEYDYQFMLHLFEFLTRYDVNHDQPITWAPLFTVRYPFTRHVQNNIKLLKSQRNMLAHTTETGLARNHIKILVGQMLSVFQNEIAVVVEKRPDVFSQETSDAVHDFVRFLETDAIDSIMETIKRHESAPQVEQLPADSTPLEPAPESLPTLAPATVSHAASTRIGPVHVGITFATIVAAMALWWFWPATEPFAPPTPPRIVRHYVVAVGRPSTTEQAGKFVRHVAAYANAQDPVVLTLLSASGDSLRFALQSSVANTTSDSVTHALSVVNHVDDWETFIRLYQRAIDASVYVAQDEIASGDSVIVYLAYLGATPTKEAWDRFRKDSALAATVKFRQGSIARIGKHHIRTEFVGYDSISTEQARFINEKLYKKSSTVNRSLITIQ
ncbi:MAG: hypothetical protein FGM24_09925 [Candidatus Kapabacteria bacterium]|nr:hypothetical protein [Candidatus Kapabacteria bacterium]